MIADKKSAKTEKLFRGEMQSRKHKKHRGQGQKHSMQFSSINATQALMPILQG